MIADALGGINFIRAPEITYLLSTMQAASFHPPSKRSAAESLVNHHRGHPLTLA